MSKQLTEEQIQAASDTIDVFLDALSDADKKKQQKALSKYVEFLFDSMVELIGKETPSA